MTKTAKQIVDDVVNLLSGSILEAIIKGKIYRKGFRPNCSNSEDIIVIFTTGDPSQIQRGVVTVNIYVPDKLFNDQYVEDGRRCETIEIAAQQWVDSLTTDRSLYRFKLMQTIHTESEPEINQHFVVVKLKYDLLTN